jgi:exopolyphosphatase/guanosine-5'-triphosphate,3'-diphosphate pyrophosphatase
MNLGKKYHYDESHNCHVAEIALEIFDALINEHGMTPRDRMLLEVAAVLHDVGMFIRSSGHHKHGQYIVSNSEIFGLHGDELAIVANVIGHHRGEAPESTDFEYMALQREERILVLKMTSILRVADALDRGHSQQIKKINVEKKTDTVIISTEGAYDLSLERLGLEEKGLMFQDVFGYKILLTHAG